MPAKKTAAKAPVVKTEWDEVTQSTRVVLPSDQQGLMDEMAETGLIPEGYNFTPHNAGQPFTKNTEEIPETPDDQPPV